MNVKKIVLGATTLLIITSCGKKPAMSFGENTGPQACKVQAVSKQNATLENVYPVSIKGQEDIEIRPRIDGFIKAIYVDEGAVVRKGQALFKIDSPQSEQSLRTAKAQVESAKAQVNTAKLNVESTRPLAEKGIVSKVVLDTAENSLQTAKAALAQAEAALKNAMATVGWTDVTSPVDGVVGSIPYRLGSLVNSANVLTTVANTSNVYAYFSMNEKETMNFLNLLEGKTQAEKIKNAPGITLTLADGTIYPEKGKLETITGTMNVTTGSASFRAEFMNKQGVLRSGTSGKISIPRVLENVIIIPQKATFSQQDKVLVYKVQGDSVVQNIISVEPTPDGQSYAVTKGLAEGDKIAVDGILTLSNGKKIIAQ